MPKQSSQYARKRRVWQMAEIMIMAQCAGRMRVDRIGQLSALFP